MLCAPSHSFFHRITAKHTPVSDGPCVQCLFKVNHLPLLLLATAHPFLLLQLHTGQGHLRLGARTPSLIDALLMAPQRLKAPRCRLQGFFHARFQSAEGSLPRWFHPWQVFFDTRLPRHPPSSRLGPGALKALQRTSLQVTTWPRGSDRPSTHLLGPSMHRPRDFTQKPPLGVAPCPSHKPRRSPRSCSIA